MTLRICHRNHTIQPFMTLKFKFSIEISAVYELKIEILDTNFKFKLFMTELKSCNRNFKFQFFMTEV